MGSRSDELRKRLEALNGGPLAKPPAEAPRPVARAVPSVAPEPRQPIIYSRTLPQHVTPPTFSSLRLDTVVRLEEAVAGTVVAADPYGSAYVVTTPVSGMEGNWRATLASLRRLLATPDTPLQQQFAHHGAPVAPEDLLFVDLETTGLGSSPLFLIGTLVWEGDDLIAKQYLARHYGEEAAVTQLFAEQLRGKRLLVTFNGKSFDLPYVRVRAAAHRIRLGAEPPHFDLLHVCRRHWRGRLPNCKLQTLERHLCGRARTGDIPGADIPDAYHAYVRTENAAAIVDILHHNLLDLATMAELLTRLPAPGG
jgi:uncharacterized protein YprB with RNaseH-like and TPR domain